MLDTLKFYKVTALPDTLDKDAFYYVLSDGAVTPYLTDSAGAIAYVLSSPQTPQVQTDWDVTDNTLPSFLKNKPTALSAFDNDEGFITIAVVPTHLSELTNDVGFITAEALPTKVSQLQNDSGYITVGAIPTHVSAFTNDAGYITIAAVPTKLSQLQNDEGYISANQTITLTGGVTGSGTTSIVTTIVPAGSSSAVQYNNSGVLAGAANLHISVAGNVLVGTTTDNGSAFQVTGNITTSGNVVATGSISSNGGGPGGNALYTSPSGFGIYIAPAGTQAVVLGGKNGAQGASACVVVQNGANFTSSFDIYTQSGTTAMARFANTGNVLINTTTDSGQKLQVNGSITATNTTAQLTLLNSATNFVTLLADTLGGLHIGSSAAGAILSIPSGGLNFTGGGTITGQMAISSPWSFSYTSSLSATNAFTFTHATPTYTTGNANLVTVAGLYTPTTGTGTYVSLAITTVINQTGGANGITRGLYINPTLTAAAAWRSIEVVKGNSYFGTTSGNLIVGTTSDSGAFVQIAAGTAAKAQMHWNAGVAPTTPTDGDVWFDNTALYMHIGGVTRTFNVT